jgi:hypothetical protein
MNLAHIHLLLNHFPSIGFMIGVVLFVVALFSRSADLRKMALVVFFLIAVLAIPAYTSGNAAEYALCPDNQCPPNVSPALIRIHEDSALFAFTFMGITGFFSWLALWQLRRSPSLPAWNAGAVLLPALVAVFFISAAAQEGSEIRHPEIELVMAFGEGPPPVEAAEAAGVEEAVAEPAAPAEAAEPDAAPAASAELEVPGTLVRSIGEFVSGATGYGWAWPAAETLHFIGLCLLFTAVLLVDLRVLGMAKSVPFHSVYQLLPLGMLGFVINLITGMLFFIASPHQYANNGQFHWKVLFIVLAGINALYFMVFDEVWDVKSGGDAPARAKFAAISAIALWVGVLFFGHMLPFLGNSF